MVKARKSSAKRKGIKARRAVKAKRKVRSKSRPKARSKAKTVAKRRVVKPKTGPVEDAVGVVVGTVQDAAALRNKLAGHNTFED